MDSSSESWIEVQIEDLGDIYCGQSVSAAEVNIDKIGEIYITGPEQWDGKSFHINKWTAFSRRSVPEGCIFLTVKGAGIGKVFPGIKSSIGRDIYAFRPSGNLDFGYTLQAICHRITTLITDARGDIPGLSRDHLAKYRLPLPPLSEQRRIVAKLDALTARLARARAELDRVSMLTQAMKRNVLQVCFDRNRTDAIELGSLLQRIEAGNNLRCEERPPRAGELGVVKVSAVTWGRFDPSQSKTLPHGYAPPERARIRRGDLLISRANTLELVGAVVLVDIEPKDLFLSDKILRLVLDEDLKRWVLWFLRSEAGRRQIESLATGNQLSMRNISQGALRSIRLPLPDAKTRRRLIDRIEASFTRADRLEAEVSRARALLDRLESAILAKAFRGELVPQDPNDEPASVLLERIRAERAAQGQQSGRVARGRPKKRAAVT